MAKIYIHTGRSKTTSQASSGNGGGSYGYDFSVLRYIKIVNGKMLVTIPLGSTGDIFAKGDEGSGGGSGAGTLSYNRLDRWSDYTAARAGDVLSALLGYDLHMRIQAIESGQLEMTWDNISGKPLTFTPSVHNHPISQINGLDGALADKAPLSHVGDVSHLTAGQRAVLDSFSVINGKVVANKPLGSISDVFAKGADGGAGGGTPSYSRLDAWADYASTKAGYVLSALLGYDLHTRLRTIETGQIPLTWDNITGKPATFTPSAHNHTFSQVTGLQAALEGKVGVVAGKGLSTNDYTTAEKTKLAGLSNYIHPSFTARTISAAAGLVLSAIAINTNGHVSAIESKTLVAADIPTLAISHISGLQSALDAKAPLSHVGDISHLTAGQRAVLDSFSVINGKVVANKPLGSISDVFAKGADGGAGGGTPSYSRLDAWADYASTKAGYVLSALLGYDLHTRLRTIETGQIPLTWDNITGKPATFTPSAHNHTIAQINGLGEALDGKQPIGNYALSSSLNDYLRNDYLSGRVKVNANDILKGVEASYLSSSASNKPGGTDYALLSLSYSGVWSVQMAGDWRTNNWLVRNKNNGTWGSWATLFHSGNSNKSDVDWTSNYVTANSFRTPFAEFRDYNGRMSLATYNFASGYGLNVNNLLVSNQWSDYTKVPALGIYAEGNIKAGGEVSNKSSSDEAFKTDLVTIMKGSDILKKLRPVEFTWNGLMRKYNPDKVGKSASFIAQEFGKVLPWAVSQIYEKYLAIDKEAVIPYLVSGWQEHESELNTLKRRVLSLENEVKQLKNIA